MRNFAEACPTSISSLPPLLKSARQDPMQTYLRKRFARRFFVWSLLANLFFVGCKTPPIAPALTWQERSNILAQEYAFDFAKIFPEQTSALGYREFDGAAIRMTNDFDQRHLVKVREWQQKLSKIQNEEPDAEFRADAITLLMKVNEAEEVLKIEEEIGEIPFYAGSNFVYESLRALVIGELDLERRKQGAVRFRTYSRGEKDFKPLLVAMQERTVARIEKYRGKQSFWPLKAEVEKYLKNSPTVVMAIAELLSQTGDTTWQNDLATFQKQVVDYDRFLTEHLLPRARTEPELPMRLYNSILRQRGVESNAESLIALARSDYETYYKKFRELGRQIAKKKKLPTSDPGKVIKTLKSRQITQPADVAKLYSETSTYLTKIINENQLITLPEEPLRIRVAGDSESKVMVVPRLRAPAMVGLQNAADLGGERALKRNRDELELIVPTSSLGQRPYDDFSFSAVAKVLLANEGRPGKELKYRTILKHNKTLIRARYAWNAVNIEAWGLYAEDLVFPFLSDEEQLVALQSRLWQTAKAFLDPQFHARKVTDQKVMDLLVKDLGVSPEMAKLELQRHKYDEVGRAPAHYFGLKVLQGMKERAEARLGPAFNLQCFNDSLLSYGLLSLSEIATRMEKDFQCVGKEKALSKASF